MTIFAKARELGIRDALEKFAAFTPGVVRPRPIITANSIANEYQQLAAKHPQLTGRFPAPVPSAGMAKELGSLDPGIQKSVLARRAQPAQAAPAAAAPAMSPEQAMLAKLRKGMAGGASAGLANAMDKNPALVGKAAPVKVAAAKLLPPSQQPRSNNIPMVFAENEALGNPSLGNPGMSNISGSGSLQGAIARWKSDHMGGVGKWAAFQLPGLVPAPTPKAPLAAGTPATEVAAAPMKTQLTGGRATPAMPVQNPNSMVAQGIMGAHIQDQLQKHLKLGGFTLFGVNRSAAKQPGHTEPGKISPDNGHRLLGTNFDLPRNGGSAAVSSAWNSHNVQRNQDFLNEGNEGSVGSPGA